MSRTGMATLSSEDLQEFGDFVWVSEACKLVYFSLSKIASTQFLQLIRRAEGADDWRSNPHHVSAKPLLRKLGCERAADILTDSTWVKMVFIRDPAERLLSAWLDKFVRNPGYANSVLWPGASNMTFDQFVVFVLDPNTDESKHRGLHRQSERHWRPQVMVGGLGKWWPTISFVGEFDNLRADTERLLRQFGVWQALGAQGWSAHADSAMFATNEAVNRTGARARMNEFYDSDKLNAVREAYAMDYELHRVLRRIGPR